jgi:PAS domain S-box-containing protein
MGNQLLDLDLRANVDCHGSGDPTARRPASSDHRLGPRARAKGLACRSDTRCMTRAPGSASRILRSAAVAAAFACLYFLTAKLTGWLIGDPAVLWPASGVYLGVMLVAPRQMWSMLACAAGVGSLLTYLHGGASLELSIAFAVPSSAEGLLAALLVERIAGGRFRLAGVRDLVALVVGGAIVANGLVALSAAAVAVQSFDAPFAESWLRWWSADALGMLAVVPIFTAERRGVRAAAIGGLVVSLVAANVGSDLYAVQGFLAVLLLGSHGFAAATGERERLHDDLGRSKEELARRREAAARAARELYGSADRVERADRRIAQLTAELAARTAEVHDATREHERLSAEAHDLETARERAERDLADAKGELSRARNENGTLEGELSRANRQNGALEEELSRASRHNDELEEKLSRVSRQNGSLKEELSRVSRENGSLKEELSRVSAERGSLREELSRAGAESDAMEEELSGVSRQNRALEEAMSRVSAQHSSLREELSRAKAQEDALAEELSRERAQAGALEKELSRERAQNDALAGELSHAGAPNGALEEELAQAQQALEQARALLLEERARLERQIDEVSATLARSEAERRLLADHATELIARYDERGMCLYASPASRRLLGYEPEELVNHAGAELLHPEDRHLLARARATRAETTFEARLRRKAGDYIWVEVLLRPVLSHDGDRVVAVNTTIRATSPHRDLHQTAA